MKDYERLTEEIHQLAQKLANIHRAWSSFYLPEEKTPYVCFEDSSIVFERDIIQGVN